TGGDLAAVNTDGSGRPGPLQGVQDEVVAAPSDLLGVLDRGVDERLHLVLGHRVQHGLVVVDREHELHRMLLTRRPYTVIRRDVSARALRYADTDRRPART